MSNKIAGVVMKLVSALETLDNAEERRRAVTAALTVCGDPAFVAPGADDAQGDRSGGASVDSKGIHSAGLTWMQRNSLTDRDIEQVFHIDESGATLLSAVGEGKREQTINAYLLTGAAALLSTGKAEFTDETARRNCENLGCYDMNNHGNTLKKFGNKITGSKSAGWKLTAPGLATAAALLKTPTRKEAR